MAKKKPKRISAGHSHEAVMDRETQFINQYFILNKNATKAAIAAGYSPHTAGSQGAELLRKPRIRKKIDERLASVTAEVEFTAEEVIRGMARAHRFDPRKLYKADGSMKRIIDLDDDTALELEGADIEEFMRRGAGRVVTSKIRYPKKSTARDQAMRFFGLNAKDKDPHAGEDDDVPVPVKVTIEFKDARKKGR